MKNFKERLVFEGKDITLIEYAKKYFEKVELNSDDLSPLIVSVGGLSVKIFMVVKCGLDNNWSHGFRMEFENYPSETWLKEGSQALKTLNMVIKNIFLTVSNYVIVTGNGKVH